MRERGVGSDSFHSETLRGNGLEYFLRDSTGGHAFDLDIRGATFDVPGVFHTADLAIIFGRSVTRRDRDFPIAAQDADQFQLLAQGPETGLHPFGGIRRAVPATEFLKAEMRRHLHNGSRSSF